MSVQAPISRDPAAPRPDENAVILPATGGAFPIAWADLADALKLTPVWFHTGWINVVWRFRRTRIGPFWHTLGLGAFVLVMGVLWSRILGQDPFAYFRYVSVNLIVWTLIASFVNQGTGILIEGQSTALSMRVPYTYFAFAHVWRSLLLFAHHFLLYFLILIGTFYAPGWPVVLAVPALALLLANGLWMSLLVGMLCLRWRDLVPAITTAMQIALFVTPVFWAKDMLGPELAFAADFNPLYHFVRIMREPLLGTVPPLESWLWVVGTLLAGSTVTLWAYGRCRNRIPYWY